MYEESKSYLEFMTKDEFWSLPEMGRTLAEYWTQWLPEMCRKKKADGTLLPELMEEGTRLCDLQDRLMQNGCPYDAALELVNQELYSLPPEE